MQRSDETGDDPGLPGSVTGASADSPSADGLPANAFRARIRRASVAAAHAVDMAPIEIPSAPPASPSTMTSSLPPEHSGVRTRPNEPARTDPTAVPTTLPPPVFLSAARAPSAADLSNPANRVAPRSWPFAPNADAPSKRAMQLTQMGLGGQGEPSVTPQPLHPPHAVQHPSKPRSRTPPLPAPALNPALLSNANPDARAPKETAREPAPLTAAVQYAPTSQPSVSPGAYAVSDLRASEHASSWSPEPPHTARSALLRPSDNPDAGRYSAQDLSVEYFEPAQTSDAPQLESDPGSLLTDDPLARARRFTPKQRPAHRRGRQHDAMRTSPGRTPPERAESVRKQPELTRTVPQRARILNDERDTRAPSEQPFPSAVGSLEGVPQGLPERKLTSQDTHLRPFDSQAAPLRASRVEPDGSAQPEVVRTASPRSVRDTVPGRLPTLQTSDAPVASNPKPFVPETPPNNPRLLPPATRTLPIAAASQPPSRPSAPPGHRTQSGLAGSPSTYEPLPRDRAGFEAFMRQRAVESEGSASRVNWKDQETLLVSRDSLRPKAPARGSLLGTIPWMPLSALLALVLIGSVTLWLRRQANETAGIRAVPISSTSSASPTAAPAVPTTLIATEPSGAELLLGSAVLGNTPVAVARPLDGEETYSLRMRGFESQLVRLSVHSGDAIRVTLMPQGTQLPSP